MAKAHLDVGFQPDLLDFALAERSLTSGRRRPRASVIPLEGDLEVYVKEDEEFGLQMPKRKKTSHIKSPKVKDRNQKMRECAAILDQIAERVYEYDKETKRAKIYHTVDGKKLTRHAVRKAMQACLEGKATTPEEMKSVILGAL